MSSIIMSETPVMDNVCPEFGDLNVEELLLVQESAFQYIQSNYQNKDTACSSGGTVEGQLALDEALARALYLGEDFNSLSVDVVAVSSVENTRSTLGAVSSRGGSRIIRQDDIDPDAMTYEELQTLGESLGSRSRGLPADLISRLPTFRHKSGLFSMKKKEQEDEGYKNGAKLTTLPCAHMYHSKCIAAWLHQNKQCPICQKEVKDE